MRNRSKKKAFPKPKSRKSLRSVTRRSHANYDQLETRSLLATFTVNTAIDSVANDGLLSLREAIMAADTNTAVGDATAGDAQGDIIRFAPSLSGQRITLQSGELAISDDLAIYGGTQNVSIDAGTASRIFSVNTSEQVVIRDLNLANGSAVDAGGAVLTTGPGQTVINGVEISSSVAAGMGGGAIATSNGQLLVLNSNLIGNSANGASGSGGGLLISSGDVRVSSSTLSSNVANRAGGGIEIIDGQLNFVGSVLGGASVGQGNIAGPAGSAAPGNGG